MSLTVSTQLEVRPTVGSDSACSGMFDPSQTAGMLTDGAATSATGAAPVFSSSSYNFVSGDIGAKLFIGAGTNWLPGWYPIVSVASNAATLDATLGHGTTSSYELSTVAGCASTASPTGATWSIDYSQQNAAQFTYTDLASVGSGNTVSSTAFPFASQQVGNGIQVTGGTNFNAGFFVIASVSSNIATVQGQVTLTTGAGASGTGSLGGGLATMSQAISAYVLGCAIWMKGSSGDYLVTGTQQINNAASGTGNGGATQIRGYGTIRGDKTKAVWKTATNSIHLIEIRGIDNYIFRDLEFKSTAGSPGELWYANGSNSLNVTCINCKWDGGSYGLRLDWNTDWTIHQMNLEQCEISNNGVGIFACYATRLYECFIHDNSAEGIHFSSQDIQTDAIVSRCILRNNNTASNSSDGGLLSGGSDRSVYIDSTVFANNFVNAIYNQGQGPIIISNSIIWNTTGYGIDSSAHPQGYMIILRNCALGSNSSGNFNLSNVGPCLVINSLKPLTVDPFTNQSTGDFSLNSTAGGGPVCKAAGIDTLGAVNLDIGAVQSGGGGGGGASGGSYAFVG